jgi:WD40 repeat protein
MLSNWEDGMFTSVILITTIASAVPSPNLKDIGNCRFADEPCFYIRPGEDDINSVFTCPQSGVAVFCSARDLWSVNTKQGAVVANFRSPLKATFVGGRLSTDGKSLNIVSSDGQLQQFRVASLECIASKRPFLKDEYSVAIYSGDGSQLVCYSRSGKDLEIYNVKDLKFIRKIGSPFQRNSSHCCLSSKYNQILLGGMNEVPIRNSNVVKVEGGLSTMNLRGDEGRKPIAIRKGRVDCAAISPGEEIVAIGTSGGKIDIYDLKNSTETHLEFKRDVVSALCFSDDSKYLFVGSYSLGLLKLESVHLDLWNLETKTKVCDVKFRKEIVESLSFDATTSLLFVGTRNGGCCAVRLDCTRSRPAK